VLFPAPFGPAMAQRDGDSNVQDRSEITGFFGYPANKF